jgi:hypothetical protein
MGNATSEKRKEARRRFKNLKGEMEEKRPKLKG